MSISETAPETAASSGLILDSLEIKNFRAFRHLTVEKLGRVNLITGKNNVGKSSLLEALWLYAYRGSPQIVKLILQSREEEFLPENAVERPSPSRVLYDISEDLTNVFRFLFYGRKRIPVGESTPVISIGPNKKTENSLNFFVDWEYEGPIARIGRTLFSEDRQTAELLPTFHAEYNGSSTLYGMRNSYVGDAFKNLPCRYVSVGGENANEVGLMWDKVSLTPQEDQVVEGLQQIDNRIRKINLRGGDRFSGRVPVVKLQGVDEPVTLKSLGAGSVRLFSILLALVSSDGGLVLLDEVENGLHYSILPDVWRIIFQTARRLNVQVFATTHSWDCIEAFQQAAAEDEANGALIRLQNKNGDVRAIVFDEEELQIITQQQIEVR